MSLLHTSQKKNNVDFLHKLRFLYFLHRIHSSFPDNVEVVFSHNNNRHLTDKVDYIPQIRGMISTYKILIMKSFSM